MGMGGGNSSGSLLTSDYAKIKRGHMKLVNNIRATGASVDVDLPSICVIGNQSSGKSSLIEAISGINLPRAAGTCTRCPTEVRLSETPEGKWQCRVKLRREVDEHGNLWTGEKEVPFAQPMSDPSAVEAAIRRAQLAILNPSVDYKKFENYKLPKEPEKLPLGSKKQLSFSKNVVCLEISGPNITDLTLIDLPGLIKNVGEDPNSIAIIEDLVKEYIKKDCLILLTITMLDDFNNQSAAMLAKEFDKEGKRTIGVLTKVDRVSAADCRIWLQMLRGEKEKLRHGYYVTRQPSTEELEAKITFDAARAQESSFFQLNEPWKNLDNTCRGRLGTKNLTSFLSVQLTSFINQRLPSLIQQINATFNEVELTLRSLPAPPSDDPAGEMLSLVTTFQQRVQGFTSGTHQHKSLIQHLNAIYAKFKHQIRATTPLYTPYTRSEIEADHKKGLGKDYMDVLNDPDGEHEVVRKPPTASSHMTAMLGILSVPDKNGALSSPSDKRPVTNLDDVKTEIDCAITRELPGNVPWDVKLELIEKVLKPWEEITLNAFDAVKPLVQQIVQGLVTKIFGRYEQSLLAITIQTFVDGQLAKVAEQTKAALLHAIALDDLPYTQNIHYLTNVCDKIFASLSERRCPPIATTMSEDRDTQVSKVLAGLAELGYRVKEEDLKKLNTPSEWEREIRVMAEVRAYFQIAYKRIIDDVPRTIDAEFIRPLNRILHNALLQHLSISSPEGKEKCRVYLSESPDVSAQRKDLELRRDRLNAAKEAVHRFEQPVGV